MQHKLCLCMRKIFVCIYHAVTCLCMYIYCGAGPWGLLRKRKAPGARSPESSAESSAESSGGTH